jgi:peptidoglycan/LPS O-acetylase OafA/YrhL
MIGLSTIMRPLLNSHLWHIMEELTFYAFLLQYVVITWFFASREQNTLLQLGYLTQVTVSSCLISYLLAVPFYILVERPFRNFLDLILFPKSSIFKKQKDVDDDDEEEESSSEEEVQDEGSPVLKQRGGSKKP